MSPSRRSLLTRLFLAAAIVALPLFGAAGARAQSYPTHPVTLIVPFAAGSTSDLIGRILAERLSTNLGQRVVVDNRGGAGGILAAEYVARAAPDGYTLLFGTIATHGISPAIYTKVNYDPIEDFEPVAGFGTAANVLVVPASLPVKTLAELNAYLRAYPDKANYASSGSGSSAHLSGALLMARENIKATHVPYRGGAQALTDLLRGDVQLMFYQVLPVLAHIKAGTLRALAITSPRRNPALPDVPTMKEAGLDDFEVSAWFGVYAPKKTSAEIVAKLNAEIVRVAAMPEVHQVMNEQGADSWSGTPQQLLAHTKSELARWQKAVDLAGAKLAQ